MKQFKVSVYYSTRAYVLVSAEDKDAAAEQVSEMDWRDEAFIVVDGDAEIEEIEESA